MCRNRHLHAFALASALAAAPRLAAAQSSSPAPEPSTLPAVQITATSDTAPLTDVLALARRAIRRGDPAAALRALRHHAQTEPEIALLVALERDADNHPVVEREMLRYLARYPDGPRAEAFRAYLGPLPVEAVPHETVRAVGELEAPAPASTDDDDQDDAMSGEASAREPRLAFRFDTATEPVPPALRLARQCLFRGDRRCAFEAVRTGRRPTEPELALRAVLAREFNASAEARTAMRSYILRYPDGPRAAAFREYLGPEYDVGARALLLEQARVCARAMDVACVVRLLDGRAQTRTERRLLSNARRVLAERARVAR